MLSDQVFDRSADHQVASDRRADQKAAPLSNQQRGGDETVHGFRTDEQAETVHGFRTDEQVADHLVGERQHLTDLLQIHKQRLQELEKQEAMFGIYAPPHVKTEINGIRGKIAELESSITRSGMVVPSHVKVEIANTGVKIAKLQSPPPPKIPTTAPTQLLELHIQATWSPELQAAVINFMATIADLDPSRVAVLKVGAGSVIFTLEMPQEAIQRVTDSANDHFIKEAGIEQLQPGLVFELTDLERFQSYVEREVGSLTERERQKFPSNSQRSAFQQLQQDQLDAFCKRLARRMIAGQDFKLYLCPTLRATPDNPIEIARLITPILIKRIAAGAISIPLLPTLFAAIALAISQTGVANLCKGTADQ